MLVRPEALVIILSFNARKSRWYTWLGQAMVLIAIIHRLIRSLHIYGHRKTVCRGMHQYLLYEDAGGNLWLGTPGGGLYRFNPRSVNSLRFSKKDRLPSETIYGILGDKKREPWLSTSRGGLVLPCFCKEIPPHQLFAHMVCRWFAKQCIP